MLGETAVRRVDKANLAEDVAAFPEHVAKGLEVGENLAGLAVGRRATVVGMGGSAIAGEVLGAWLAAERDTLLPVVRDFRLPAWIGEGDLIVAVSYSGNTRETLRAFTEASHRGCDLVAIASGGILMEASTTAGIPFAPIPPGHMPRAAFGYIFGALAAMFGPDVVANVREASRAVAERGENLRPSVATARNPAKKLAKRIRGRTPILYATQTYAPVARRWQTELNENAKVLAWTSVLPEADHNEIVGWSEDPAASRFAPIFLRDPAEPEEHARMMDVTRDLVKGKAKVEEVRAQGPFLLARMLTTLHLGDWTSVYLAALRGVDPTPVSVIEKLKERLAEKG